MADYDWATGTTATFHNLTTREWDSLTRRVAALEEKLSLSEKGPKPPVSYTDTIDVRDDLKNTLRWEEVLQSPFGTAAAVHKIIYRDGKSYNEFDQELNTGDLQRAGWTKKGRWVSEWMEL